jgi:hypothetical protein
VRSDYKIFTGTQIKQGASIGVSLIPGIGEAYDGWTIYTQRDPITKEPLTIVGNAFTILGLASGVGSGKVAREVGDEALRKIATKHGADYTMVEAAASEIIKETNLLELAKHGVDGVDELLAKIGERVGVKQADKLTTIASKIASGHAFDKHILEFSNLGIKTHEELMQHITIVLQNPTRSGNLERNRSYVYDSKTNTLVVMDSGHIDSGTIFRPIEGEYFVINKLK